LGDAPTAQEEEAAEAEEGEAAGLGDYRNGARAFEGTGVPAFAVGEGGKEGKCCG